MRRREFIALIGGASAWTLPVRAQQQIIPVIGFLHAGSPEANAKFVDAFRDGLSESGFVEGKTLKSNIAGPLAGSICYQH